MASKDIEQFANMIDKAITDAVSVAKNDYRERLDAIKNIYGYSDMIIQASGASRSSLAQGGVSEMQRVQREQINAVGDQIQKADDKLSSMRDTPSMAMDIMYLTGKLEEWINRIEEMTIPKGPHTSSYAASPTRAMTDIQKKWKDYCENDPTIQKAVLLERKTRLEEEIKSLTETIAGLENRLPDLKMEYDDRCNNPMKYEQMVQAEVDSEIDDLNRELRHAQEDVSDLLNQEKSMQTQLASSGLFAFGKKKELKAKLEGLSESISDANIKVSDIEKKIQTVKESLPKRIALLNEKLSQIKAEIEAGEKKVSESKASLLKRQSELDGIMTNL